MLHKKPNHKSIKFIEIQRDIYRAYNYDELSQMDIEALIKILEELHKEPTTHYDPNPTTIYKRDSEGDNVW